MQNSEGSFLHTNFVLKRAFGVFHRGRKDGHNWLASSINGTSLLGAMRPDSDNNSSQYNVSSASRKQISAVLTKWRLEDARHASRQFAPIEVPDRNTWRPRMSPSRFLGIAATSLIIRSAKAFVRSRKSVLLMDAAHFAKFLHSEFCILNFVIRLFARR